MSRSTTLAAVVLLALVYLAAGLAVTVTGLHAQVVPFWIPAGIALAAVLRYGYGMLPGVFLGSFAINLWIPYTEAGSYLDYLMLASAVTIAAGATVQAGLAAWLIQRVGADPLQPKHYKGLFLFVLFAGLLTCMLGASVGTLALSAFSDLSANMGALRIWVSWWMGDAFGAVLITPLCLAVLPSKLDHAYRRVRLIVQLASVSMVVIVLNQIYLVHLYKQIGNAFAQDVRVLDAQLQAITQQNLAELSMLEQLVTPEGVSPVLFRDMVLEIQQRNPAVLAYSWDPVVPAYELDTFEQHTRELINHPSFAVYGSSLYEDDPAVVVQLVEPLEYNQPALGFNLFSLADRRRWVLLSQETGRPAATQIIRLTQAPNEPGLLILHPVYLLQQRDETPLLGQKQLVGFMVGVFTVERMFGAALAQAGIANIDFSLRETGGETPFFSTHEGDTRFLIDSQFQVDIAQQRWEVHAKAGADYYAMHPISNAWLMQSLLVLVGSMGALLILSNHDRERLLEAQVKWQTQTLEYQARHDDLTGLPNRMHLMERMEARLAKDKVLPFSVLFIDLDRFKMINDSLGHQVGDALLQTIGHALSKRLHAGCELFRTGGDEFILLVEGDEERALTEASHLVQQCARPHQVGEHLLQVTASIGISHYPEHGEELDTLVKHADTAMYRAKAKGKNRFEIYDVNLTEEAVASFQLEQDLRLALKKRQLVLHFQPQHDLSTGYLCGLEALVRWQHPERGLLPPGQFISLAEETNLIVPLGWQVIEMACEQILVWQEQNLIVPPVAVNISPQQLLEADFIEHINGILGRYGIARGQFELEITESLIMQDPDYAIDQLNRLSEAGYRLALDDFGTGYSSLDRVKYLPLDRLKIDYSFTRDIGRNPRDEAIIITIIALGKSLNIEVLAEGVENEQQLEFLRCHGCTSVQGFLLGRPAPRDDVVLTVA